MNEDRRSALPHEHQERQALVDFACASANTVRAIFQDYVQLAASVSVLKSTLTAVESTVDRLDRVVRSGNGDSLVTGVRLIREQIDDIETQLNEHHARLERLAMDMESAKVMRSTWFLVAQVVAWLIATTAGILGVVL